MFKGFAVNQQSSMTKLKKEIEGYVESKSKSPRTPRTNGKTSDSGRNIIGQSTESREKASPSTLNIVNQSVTYLNPNTEQLKKDLEEALAKLEACEHKIELLENSNKLLQEELNDKKVSIDDLSARARDANEKDEIIATLKKQLDEM